MKINQWSSRVWVLIVCNVGHLRINLSRVSLVKRERIVFLIRRYMLSQSSSLIKSRVIERFELHVIKKSVLASRKSSKHQLCQDGRGKFRR